jgi:pSer/pThr/pTyr-binding forkhead associated (FHA) protein
MGAVPARVPADRGVVGETRPVTASELRAVLHAEREGLPFFVYRDCGDELRIVRLERERRRLTVGRSAAADLSIGWDRRVSALHAVIAGLAGELALYDDGLSRNGTYVNGERVRGLRRLRDRDVLRLGSTLVLVRNPRDAQRSATSTVAQAVIVPTLSGQQRKVLVALCRPTSTSNPLATVATNQEIADELYLSVAAVKLHLRALFEKFGVGTLPQNKKRLALAQRAMTSGIFDDHDLETVDGPGR